MSNLSLSEREKRTTDLVDRQVEDDLKELGNQDPNLASAYKAMAQAVCQSGILVRITLEYDHHLSAIRQLVHLWPKAVDADKTRSGMALEHHPLLLELRNGSAVEIAAPRRQFAARCFLDMALADVETIGSHDPEF